MAEPDKTEFSELINFHKNRGWTTTPTRPQSPDHYYDSDDNRPDSPSHGFYHDDASSPFGYSRIPYRLRVASHSGAISWNKTESPIGSTASWREINYASLPRGISNTETSLGAAPYQYEALLPSELRLLCISPGTLDSPLLCSLKPI